MTELLTETPDTPIAEGEVAIRSRVFMHDGRTYDVTQRYSTAKRYWEGAISETDDPVVSLNLSPQKRVALNPSHIANIEELGKE